LQHREPQRGLPARRAKGCALALDQVERAADRFEIASAGGGELDAAVEPSEQRDAQLLLEVGDASADR
jgi:hypothetical protein